MRAKTITILAIALLQSCNPAYADWDSSNKLMEQFKRDQQEHEMRELKWELEENNRLLRTMPRTREFAPTHYSYDSGPSKKEIRDAAWNEAVSRGFQQQRLQQMEDDLRDLERSLGR